MRLLIEPPLPESRSTATIRALSRQRQAKEAGEGSRLNAVYPTDRWAFVEVTDPWDAQRAIRAAVLAAGVAVP